MIVFAVDTHLLWQVVWVSLAAGVGVSTLFSLVILSSAKASEARRSGRESAAAGFAALAVLAFGLFTLGVVLGVQVMLTK